MIKDLLQKGFILKSNGFYKHAIEAFYKMLEEDNSSIELMLEIAECYYLMNNEERALNYIELILNKVPTHVESLRLLKQIFINKKAWKEAEQTTKNIFSISNNENDLAEIFGFLNKQKRFQEVIDYDSDICTASVLFEKAYSMMHLGRLSEAESLINRAIELDLNEKKLLLKSKILFKMNRNEESIEILNKIKNKLNDADSLNFIGLISQFECDWQNAIKYFKEAIKQDPLEEEYYYNCASTFFKMGDIQQAKRFYNLAISLAPNNANYHFALANLYYSQKKYKKALKELDYDLPEAKLLKAVILYDSGYLALAKKEFEKLNLEEFNKELVTRYCETIDAKLKN